MFYFLRTYTCTNGPADISYASLCTSCDSFRLRMFEFDFQIWQVETEKHNKTWARNWISSSRVLSMRGKKKRWLILPELNSWGWTWSLFTHLVPRRHAVKCEDGRHKRTERSCTWHKWTPVTIAKVYHTRKHIESDDAGFVRYKLSWVSSS